MISTKNYNLGIKFFAKLALAAMIASYSLAAHAEADNKAVLTEEFNTTFNKMLDNPSDVDLTMRYANLAMELENYEAAVPALERILLFNPDLPRVKAELGVMYFKLDSFEMAKSYLLDAKKGKNVPEDVIAKANEYLGKIK